jgi:hypothetical protein
LPPEARPALDKHGHQEGAAPPQSGARHDSRNQARQHPNVAIQGGRFLLQTEKLASNMSARRKQAMLSCAAQYFSCTGVGSVAVRGETGLAGAVEMHTNPCAVLGHQEILCVVPVSTSQRDRQATGRSSEATVDRHSGRSNRDVIRSTDSSTQWTVVRNRDV